MTKGCQIIQSTECLPLLDRSALFSIIESRQLWKEGVLKSSF